MSDNQRFDDHIKDQLLDYSPDVHPRIWENIIKEREKRRPAGFWLSFLNGRNILILAALLLATGSGAYLLLKKSAADDEKIAVVNKSTTQNTTAATEGSTNAGSNNSGNEKNDNTAVAETNTGTVNNNTDKDDTNGSSTNTGVADNTTHTVGASTGDNDITTNGAATFKNKGATAFKIRSPFARSNNENGKKNTRGSKNKNADGNDEYDIADAAIPFTDQTARDYYLKRLLFADMKKISTDKTSASLKQRTMKDVSLPGCPSIEKNAAGNKTYIEVYAGPDMAFRNLTDTGNSAYLQKRKESTKISSAFSAGIRYTKVFNNGVSLRTGINYSQVNEKFTFVQGNLVQITYIINANGDTTGSYITTGTRYKTTNNKYRTIDVPLLIGYELGNGRFHANINAGVIVNAYSWQKGEVLDTAFRPVSITTGKGNSPYQYKTNIGVGFMVGTSFYYKLNEKLHLLAEPYFRYSLQPMSNEKLTFKQKNNTAGIRIGVRLDLK